jgi:hypothetical protein
MKNTFLAIVIGLLSPFVAATAQYRCIPVPSAHANPGGLNTEDEMPSSMPSAGWRTIFMLSSPTPAWSLSAAIPFDFKFNGKSFDSCKASNSGVLTFGPFTGPAPSYSNAILPDAGIPDNSVCIRGIQGMSNFASVALQAGVRTPAIRTRIFGDSGAHNRQLWIAFTGFSAPGADSTRAILTNWSIVLEETTNYIFIVDQSTFSYVTATGGFKPDTLNAHLSIGIQIDASTACSVAGSPDVPSSVLNPKTGTALSFTCYDNSYFGFIPLPLPGKRDASVITIDAGEYIAGGPAGIHLTGRLMNYGGGTITSITLSYSADDGTPVDTTIIGLAIPSGGEWIYNTALWRPVASAKYSIRVWCGNVNAGGPDAYPSNDTAKAVTSYMIDPPGKRVLLEEFTGTWCGYCPRGLYAMEYTLEHLPDAIGYALHVENDPMKNAFSDAMSKAFPGGYPSGMIDRTTFSGYGEFRPTLNIPVRDYVAGAPFMEKAARRLQLPTPVAVSIGSSFNPSSRQLDVTVRASFEAEAAGDMRINAVLVEDSVTGNSTYDQQNYMAGDPNDPYWKAFPRVLPGFAHRHVARYNMADTNNTHGTPGVIPSSVSPGQSFNKTYSYAIPPEWNVSRMEIVAFVSRYNPDNTRGGIMNAAKARIDAGPTGIADEAPINPLLLRVYPLPFSSQATVAFVLPKEEDASVEIRDLLGRKVFSSEPGRRPAGTNELRIENPRLPAGVYLLTLRTPENTITRNICIVK